MVRTGFSNKRIKRATCRFQRSVTVSEISFVGCARLWREHWFSQSFHLNNDAFRCRLAQTDSNLQTTIFPMKRVNFSNKCKVKIPQINLENKAFKPIRFHVNLVTVTISCKSLRTFLYFPHYNSHEISRYFELYLVKVFYGKCLPPWITIRNNLNCWVIMTCVNNTIYVEFVFEILITN